MSEITRSPFSIQVAVDGSKNSLDAALLIRSLPLPPGSRVNIVGVLDNGRAPYEELLRQGVEKVEQTLAEQGVECSSYLLHGHTVKGLLEFADEHHPDLIVVGAHGLHETLKILLGGVAQEVVEYARWPVLVMRSPAPEVRRVLLAVDGSPYSQLSAEYLAQFPLPDQTEVHVMHVLPPLPDTERLAAMMGFSEHPKSAFQPPPEMLVDEQQKLAEEQNARAVVQAAGQILEASGIQSKKILVRGDPANEIISFAEAQRIDLIVTGSRGLSAIKGWWWGSVSRKLIHYSPCSVLCVRGRPESHEEEGSPT